MHITDRRSRLFARTKRTKRQLFPQAKRSCLTETQSAGFRRGFRRATRQRAKPGGGVVSAETHGRKDSPVPAQKKTRGTSASQAQDSLFLVADPCKMRLIVVIGVLCVASCQGMQPPGTSSFAPIPPPPVIVIGGVSCPLVGTATDGKHSGRQKKARPCWAC